MLELEDVNAYYGEATCCTTCRFSVQEGEVVCLLGRNGAGKTTTILDRDGLSEAALRPHRLSRPRYRALPPYEIARLGVGYVPQERGFSRA